MAASILQIERRALLGSIAVTALLGGIGIVWGIVGGSQMILLDGVYAIVIIATLLYAAVDASRRSATVAATSRRDGRSPTVCSRPSGPSPYGRG